MNDLAPFNRSPSAKPAHMIAQAIKLAGSMCAAFKAADAAIEYWNAKGLDCAVYDGDSYVRRRRDIEALPVEEVIEAAKVLRAAAADSFDAKQTTAMLGLLIDAYPSAQKADSGTLRSAVIALLEAGDDGAQGLGPRVIALGVKALLERENDFAPGPGNVVVAFKCARSHVRSRLRALEQMLTKRDAFLAREWPERYVAAWRRASQDCKELAYAPGIAMDIAPAATRTLAEELT